LRFVLVSGVLVAGVLVSGVVPCSCELPSVFINGKTAHCATRCVLHSRDLTPFVHDASGFAFGVPLTITVSTNHWMCGCVGVSRELSEAKNYHEVVLSGINEFL
jgi:hypothetical protein